MNFQTKNNLLLKYRLEFHQVMTIFNIDSFFGAVYD